MSNSEGLDLILHQGRFATLDRSNPTVTAIAIKGGRFVQVGHERDIVPLAGRETRVIDLIRAPRIARIDR